MMMLIIIRVIFPLFSFIDHLFQRKASVATTNSEQKKNGVFSFFNAAFAL